ncbi:hypothetical protein GCM10022631_03760 [Deinococcus rubellus]|uniref:DUF998 domain-containing protein n=1 Tax=Deinococcus rubellus TaxID=1889240 RepID=A0ABY5YEV6_9DEIO|nr:DUF998 domain-containing protein [Deinococcus rubellus]UWX63328.1 DUF998 domain-containing protein [Deinococcus rubellus]
MTASQMMDRRFLSLSRVLAWAALSAQIVFVLSWLLAVLWQGPRYSVLAHSISDMYAVTAPHGAVLVVVLTLCGAAVVLFAAFSLWPALKSAGWSAALGCTLLVLSIFGLGDLLSPFERLACRLADAGCGDAAQVANLGGTLDSALSTVGAMLFVAAGFFLAPAMKKLPQWRQWANAVQGLTIAFLVFFVATGLLNASGWGGLFERLLALAGAVAIALLAYGVLRQPHSAL